MYVNIIDMNSREYHWILVVSMQVWGWETLTSHNHEVSQDRIYSDLDCIPPLQDIILVGVLL